MQDTATPHIVISSTLTHLHPDSPEPESLPDLEDAISDGFYDSEDATDTDLNGDDDDHYDHEIVTVRLQEVMLSLSTPKAPSPLLAPKSVIKREVEPLTPPPSPPGTLMRSLKPSRAEMKPLAGREGWSPMDDFLLGRMSQMPIFGNQVLVVGACLFDISNDAEMEISERVGGVSLLLENGRIEDVPSSMNVSDSVEQNGDDFWTALADQARGEDLLIREGEVLEEVVPLYPPLEAGLSDGNFVEGHLEVDTSPDEASNLATIEDGLTAIDEDSPSALTITGATIRSTSPPISTVSSLSPTLSSRSPSEASTASATTSVSVPQDLPDCSSHKEDLVSPSQSPDWSFASPHLTVRDVALPIIFGWLDVESILICESTCVAWRDVVRNHGVRIWSTHWMRLYRASTPISGIEMKRGMMLQRRWERSAMTLGSIFHGFASGVANIYPVESTHRLPPPLVLGRRQIIAVMGSGVRGPVESDPSRSYFLSAHPVGLSSVDLNGQSLVDPSIPPRVKRHLDFSKRLCGFPPAFSSDWVPVSAWTPGLPGVGESFWFYAAGLGEGGEAPSRLVRSTSLQRLDDDVRGVPFPRSDPLVNVDVDWGAGAGRALRIDFPVEYGDSVGCVFGDTFVVAFQSGLPISAADMIGCGDEEDHSDGFFGRQQISSPVSDEPPPALPSPKSPHRKRSISLLRKRRSTQSLTNLTNLTSLPLLQSYRLSPHDESPTLLWSIPRPQSQPDRRVPSIAANANVIAYVDHQVPFTPSQRFRERIQCLVDGHEATCVRVRAVDDGRDLGKIDLGKRGLWVRGVHVTGAFLIILAIQAPPSGPGGLGGGIVDRHPVLRGLLGRPTPAFNRRQQPQRGPPQQTTPPLSPLTILIHNLHDLSPLTTLTLNDLLVPTEGCSYGIQSSNETLSIYTSPPASLSVSLMAEGASEQDVWPTLPSLVRVGMDGRGVTVFRRRAERFLMPNAGIGGGMRGDPGGMWVVFAEEEGGVERCVWLRRPC
ncbi:hypothetical protein HDU67_002800 [Dinochytrium kinnereticum]|nr:hypothetical protein HDU67_002800 [Dinochytrium kinnereticum]